MIDASFAAAGALTGFIVGCLLARRVSGRWIQLLLATVLLVAGLKTLAL